MAITEAAPEPEVRHHLAAVLEILVPADLGKQMADRLAAEVPELAELSDPDFRAGLEFSCTDNLTAIWQGRGRGPHADAAAGCGGVGA
jgi:hypothetical protein